LLSELQHPGLEWLIFIKVSISHLYSTHNQTHIFLFNERCSLLWKTCIPWENEGQRKKLHCSVACHAKKSPLLGMLDMSREMCKLGLLNTPDLLK